MYSTYQDTHYTMDILGVYYATDKRSYSLGFGICFPFYKMLKVMSEILYLFKRCNLFEKM